MTTHLSVRLTWHDNAWNGHICKKPECNSSCVQHQHIREARRLDAEKQQAGKHLSELPEDMWLPPCSRDTGAYAEQGYAIDHNDPLQHRRLKSTQEELLPYTCCPSPYRWMREENLRDILNAEDFKLRPNDDGREAGWVFETDRQRVLLDNFWAKLDTGKSLVFYYLNQANPLSEQESRILVGIGRISRISQQLYFGTTKRFTDSYPIWSRAVTQNYPDEGVRIPYQEYLDAGHDPANIICAIPAGATAEFSYVAEHVNDDIALSVVERFIQSVEQVKSEGLVSGEWDRHLEWLDNVLAELWSARGAFPGIGSILQYLGFSQGTAYHRAVLAPKMREQVNIWEYTKSILDGDHEPDDAYAEGLKKAAERWRKLKQRQELLAVLARFEITKEQVERIAKPEERNHAEIISTDSELLSNPFLICEQDLGTAKSLPVSLETIDHGLRPEGYAALFPPADEVMQDDARRIRAIAVDLLKKSAQQGDCLLSRSELMEGIKSRFPERRQCKPDVALLEADEEFYLQGLAGKMTGDDAWVALKSINQHEQHIAKRIKSRSKRTNKIQWKVEDWQQRLHDHPKIGTPKNKREEQAIQEKLSALHTLLTQRISILTGGAGTGKTTVLKVFLDGLEKIEGKKPLLLLAPTGKARVRLAGATQRGARTVHQFLLQQDWCDPATWRLKNHSSESPFLAKTVVIDECSMLSVDLLGTLIQALEMEEISRLILVGDPNQLPPIGPGRPFVDVIAWLNKNAKQCIAELATCMRTVDGDENKISTGLELANSYRTNHEDPTDDELLSQLAQGQGTGDVEIRFWNDADELMAQVATCLQDHLNISDYDDFSNSFGFTAKDWRKSEDWQILSPTRQNITGTDEINRLIQEKFKGGLLYRARTQKGKESPFGDSEIIWSDKVIQISNQSRKGWPLEQGSNYVANGEIGLVGRTCKGEKTGKDYLQVYFSTQPEVSYRYYRTEVDVLELAYALTVHKAQGSDFGITYLIVPQSASTLSRELIYTGLTRFRSKLVLLVERDIQPLLRLRNPNTSDVEQRNTFMFELVMRSDAKQKIFAENLIHRAKNGEPMRSKSEVIVANILLDLGLNPRYEEPLYIDENKKDFRLPDFTISYEGDTYYWEHLGMLSLPSYRDGWQRKKQWYENNGLWDSVITSEDSIDGGIDAKAIEGLARSRILLEDE